MHFIEPHTSFGDIVGLKKMKVCLQDIALSIRRSIEKPELTFGAKLSRLSVLLYGPPGSGKTNLALAIATDCGVKFMRINCGQLFNRCTMYSLMSRTDKVKAVFSTAEKNAPCAIFFDEVDAIQESGRPVGLNPPSAFLQLLKELDEPRNEVIILASANKIELVEKSLIRRFRYRLEVGLPSEEDRREIVKIQLKKIEVPKKVEVKDKTRVIEWLTKETEGLSSRDIQEICQKALFFSIPYEFVKQFRKVIVKPYRFEMALEALKQEREKRIALA